MSKVSVLFLVGISAVALSGVARSQSLESMGATDAKNSMSVIGSPKKSTLTLAAPDTDTQRLANVAAAMSAGDATSSLKNAGTDLPKSNLTIGGAASTQNGGAGLNAFVNALGDGSVAAAANALGAGAPAAKTDSRNVALIGLGNVGTADAASALVDRPPAATIRLGGK